VLPRKVLEAGIVMVVFVGHGEGKIIGGGGWTKDLMAEISLGTVPIERDSFIRQRDYCMMAFLSSRRYSSPAYFASELSCPLRRGTFAAKLALSLCIFQHSFKARNHVYAMP